MNTKRNQLLIAIFTFPILTVISYLLLCVVYCIPTDRIGLHVRESAEMFAGKNLYKELSKSDITTKQDYFTDILMMLTAAYDGDETPFNKAISNFRVEKKDANLAESCAVCNKLPISQQVKRDYSRYWHGYLIPLKIVFYFMNINEFRSLNLLLVLGLLIMISLLLYKRGAEYIFPLLIAYAFINPLAISVSIQYLWIYYITCLAIIVMLQLWNNSHFQNWMWYYFMLIGMVTSFMDLLTYPIATLGFPLILYFALSELPTFRIGFQKLVGYSVSWGTGYAGFWICKWLLSCIITQKNYISSGIGQVMYRAGNVAYETVIDVSVVFKKHLGVFYSSSLRYVVLLSVIVSVILLFYFGVQKTRMVSCIMILLIAVYPLLWYAGTVNHSYIHFFTYRALSVSLFAITSFLRPLIKKNTFKIFER